ncbi:MAG TPA: hypothetical protein VF306_07990 [Pirellulales bacterium]
MPWLAFRSKLAIVATAVASCVVLSGSGCAAVKAARQPDKKNLGVLHEGTPRTHVVAELGPPTWTRPRPDGSIEDVFSFKQGYSKGAKMGRAFMHGAADVATGGLWEVVGIPAEIWADGTDVQVVVSYDKDERVKYRQFIKGQEAVQPRKGLLARRKNRNTRSVASTRRPPPPTARPQPPGEATLSDAPVWNGATPVSATGPAPPARSP